MDNVSKRNKMHKIAAGAILKSYMQFRKHIRYILATNDKDLPREIFSEFIYEKYINTSARESRGRSNIAWSARE